MPDDLVDKTFNIEARQRYGIEEVPGEDMGYFSAISKAGNPKFFKLRAQLLDDGRDIVPLAETDNLWTWIKVYASGGENVLHSHENEDHMFIVLHGRARFYGPNKEEKELGRNEGLMLPAGTYYYFNSCAEEPWCCFVSAHAPRKAKSICGADPTAKKSGAARRKTNGKRRSAAKAPTTNKLLAPVMFRLLEGRV